MRWRETGVVFRLVSTWRLDAPAQSVWDAVERVEEWPRWWRGMAATTVVRPPDAQGLGQRTYVVVRSPLGYRLAFGVEIVAARAPYVARARVVGDLVGSGEWSVARDQAGCVATIRWDVEPARGPLRVLTAPLAGPLVWAHAVVMRRGERGLRDRLERHR